MPSLKTLQYLAFFVCYLFEEFDHFVVAVFLQLLLLKIRNVDDDRVIHGDEEKSVAHTDHKIS